MLSFGVIVVPAAPAVHVAEASHGCDERFGSYWRDASDRCRAGRHFIARSRVVNWASTEDNQAHKDFWRPYWLVVAPNEYGTTHLDTREVSPLEAYILWRVDPVQFTNVGCIYPSSNPVECSQALIRFRQSAYPSATGQARAQAVCHEMGHTVGFGEYAFGHIGCMGGGTSNGGQIHNEEVAAINYCYAFGSC
jgi:hypothetical protein